MVSRVATYRRELTPRQSFWNEPQVNAIRDAGCELRIGGIVHGVDLQPGVDNAPSLPQPTGIADDQWAATIVKLGVTKAFYDYLRPDPRCVAHGNANDW